MKQKGFTLIELMITVAIIGIIAAIAYPSYTGYVQDARRSEAQGSLAEAAQWMERQFTVDGRYTANSDGDNRSISAYSTDSYTLAVESSTTSTYTLTATPVAGGAQASDRCKILTLDNIGVKAAKDSSNTAISDCW
ncbi:MAG: type IV pilin protein [Pontibacterium sp.]